MFESVLIANRGEIAVRVACTCRRMGIRTIAVYSEADARSLHVRSADAAYLIGRAAPRDSYLNQASILDAARQSGAAAIHPGYGFLSENAEFAQACIDAGLAWVGPSPEAMRLLGNKAEAKVLAERAGVPLLPGYHGHDQTPALLLAEAVRIGFPVLIKAAAGGGGRGMRVVEDAASFSEALEAAQREAIASFGDGRLLLEKYLRRPRHVEVQIFGDHHGNLLTLGERDCSIQRRHQKLVEETPAPHLPDGTREALEDAARRLAHAAGYANAGTVEFILDEDGTFAFLEVNTRLQVEHPVTEAVSGLDLVELQLRVTAGEALPPQDSVQLRGHAIEVRILAEDPLAGYLPSSGRLTQFEPPSLGRNDAGFASGDVVPPQYDSMLGKLIVHAPAREACLHQLQSALAAYAIEGVANNLDLLLAIARSNGFRKGGVDTQFLATLDQAQAVPPEVVAAAAGAFFFQPPPPDPWKATSAWRPARLDMPSTWLAGGVEIHTSASAEPGLDTLRLLVGEREFVLSALPSAVLVDNVRATVSLHADHVGIEMDGRFWRLKFGRAPVMATATQADAAATLLAPMAGTIVKMLAVADTTVERGVALVVMEAMKMEHVLRASAASTIRRIAVHEGDVVQGGALLIELEP